jgi:hypothetical protein
VSAGRIKINFLFSSVGFGREVLNLNFMALALVLAYIENKIIKII